jgi:biopolymer transport protein ExbD
MARHRKYEAAEEADPALDISSLIDVCFLLLIYFLVTSTITHRGKPISAWRCLLPTRVPSNLTSNRC